MRDEGGGIVLKKRLLSLLLAFAMMLQMFSGVALAAGYPVPEFGAQDAIAKVNAGTPVSVSHRAAWRNGPECSLIAIYESIIMGIDVAELDVKVTSDGVPVLMHDQNISRTTTGSGDVEKMTWKELKSYPVEDGQGGNVYTLTQRDVDILMSLPNYVEHCGEPVVGGTMPTTRLDDAIDLIKKYGPKTMINWDHCFNLERFVPSYTLFRETGMLGNVFFKNSNSASTQLSWYEQAAAAWNEKHPESPITAEDVNKSVQYVYIANAPSELSKMQDHLNAEVNFVMAEICIGDDAEDADYLAKVEPWCKENGVAMFVNTMWSGLCSTKEDTETTWAEMLKRGYVAIQTDQASELAKYMTAYNSVRNASSVIQAEHFHNFNYDNYGLKVAESADANLNKLVEGMESGDWMEYRNISFDGSEVMLNLKIKGQTVGSLFVYVDGREATNLIAQIDFSSTSDYQLASAELLQAVSAGNHTVYLQVSGVADTDLVSIDNFQFISSGAFGENAAVADVVVETQVGVAPELPGHVEVTVGAGTEDEAIYGLEVRWEQVAAGSYADAGPFTVLGYVPVLSRYIEATVNVIEPGIEDDGLVLWLDASEGVAASNNAVSTWTSKVGDAEAIVATPKAGSPTLVAKAAGDKAGIYFDGNDAFAITMPENFWNSDGEDATYTVLMYTASEQELKFTDSNTVGVHGSNGSAQENSVLYFPEVDMDIKDIWGSVHFGVAQNRVNWRFGSGTIDDRGDTYIRPTSLGTAFTATAIRKQGITDTLFIDGELIYSGSSDRAYTDRTQSTGWIGMGKNTTYYKGTICEILIYDRALTDAEIVAAQKALAEKYADPVASIADVEVECRAGMAPELPGKVEVTYASGKKSQLVVTWEKINPNYYVKEGTFEVKGTLATGEEIVAKVTVKAIESVPEEIDKVPITDMMFWLKSSEGVTTNNDGKITEWASVVGENKAISTGSAYATLKQDAVNGMPAVAFTGNNVLQMTLESGALNGLENVTVVVYAKSNQNVVKHDGENLKYNVQRNTLFYANESGGWGSFYVGIFKDVLSARFGTGTSDDYGYYANRPSIEDYSATVIRWTGEDKTYDVEVDGNHFDEGTSKADKTANNSNVVYFGAGKMEGGNNTYWNGEVCEIMVYDRALTDDELSNIYKYLEDTYESETNTNNNTDGLALWLDASDASTLTVDNNGEVTAWKSKVGDIVATISAGSNTPTLMEDVAHTGDGLHFDGNDYLTVDMEPNSSDNKFWNGTDAEYTVIMYTATEHTLNGTKGTTAGVHYSDNGEAQNKSVLYFGEFGSGWGSVHFAVAQNQLNWRFGSGPIGDNGDRGNTYVRESSIGTAYTSTVVRKDGATDTLFVDGDKIYTGAAKLATTMNTLSSGTIGKGKSGNFEGTICEILIYNRALSDEEISKINEYLDEKYTNTTKDGLLLWLDASDEATMTVSEGKVTSWKSKVGSYEAKKKWNMDAAILTSNIEDINGKNAITFDGGDVYEINMDVFNGLTEATFIAYTASRTQWKSDSDESFEWNVQRGNLFTVNEENKTPGWGKVYLGIYTDAISARFGTKTENDYGFRMERDATTDYTTTTVRWSGADMAYDVDVDGKDFGTGVSLAGMTANNKNIVYLGAGDDNVCWKGDLCELLIFDRTLTDEELEKIYAYLDKKYTPEQIPVTDTTVSEDGLALWLDASEASTLTTEDGKVSAWASKVPYNDSTITASVSANTSKPTLITNTAGTGEGVKFDGTSDYLDINMPDGFWNRADAKYTVIMYVSSKDTTNGANATGGSTRNAQFNNVMWFGEPNISEAWGSAYFNASQNEINWRFGSGVSKDYGTTFVRPSNIGEAYTATVIRKDGKADTVFVDGTRVYSGESASAGTANVLSNGWIGRGKNENGATYFEGTICELLIYDRALTNAEIASINNYLEEKYDPANIKGVTGIYLKEEGQQITLYKEETSQLTASTVPANADNTALTYTSSNPAVATVDESGKITAIGWGYATITVTTEDGNYKATCTVFVDKTESDKIWQNIQDILNWADKQDEEEYWNWDQTLGAAIKAFGGSGLTADSEASQLQAQYNKLKAAMLELLEPVEYTFTEASQNQTVEVGTALTVEILPDGKYLISVQVDKITLEESQYTITSAYDNPYESPYALRQTTSGMIITLSESYMSTITQGEHSLCVVYANEAAEVETKFTVVKSATGVALDKTSLTLKEGEAATLIATVSPEGATDSSAAWTSSNEAVATVDANGKVTAVTAGTATITVTTTDGGYTASCAVTVTRPVTGVTLDKTSLTLKEGETATLTATVSPAGVTDSRVTWTSSDDKIATVDASGKVVAVSKGTVTITVTTEDGAFTDSIEIEVTCKHPSAYTTGKKDATCTSDGYSGDQVCNSCGEVVQKGHTVSKRGHSYSDGTCTRCGAGVADNTTSAPTGDTANLTLWITMICLAGGMMMCLFTFKRRERR